MIAIGVSCLVVGVPVAQAAIGAIDEPAVVSEQAERIPVPTTVPPSTVPTTTGPPSGGDLFFPIDPEPRCEVFNNFGGYSKYFGSAGHQGVDIGTDFRQEVYAVEDGFLYREFEGSGSGLGWGLWSDTDVKYRYFHLDELEPGLSVGDRVEVGQRIGYVGDTGNATPGGWHLHFEVRPGPEPHKQVVDPVPLLATPAACNVY